MSTFIGNNSIGSMAPVAPEHVATEISPAGLVDHGYPIRQEQPGSVSTQNEAAIVEDKAIVVLAAHGVYGGKTGSDPLEFLGTF